MAQAATWRSRDVWLISLSAGFADLGYQAIVAGVPLLIVVDLRASAVVYGVAAGLGYGLGTFASLAGGRLADRVGRRPVAIGGNLGILLLSLIAVARSVPVVVLLFVLGWLARNFRSPVRRAMLTEAVAPEWRRNAFGLLHAVDVGGGVLSALAAVVLVGAHVVGLRGLFAFTAIPIAISSLLLAAAHPHRKGADHPPHDVPKAPASTLRRAVLAATALYGFSSYALGFPVLAVAARSGSATEGFGAYALFLGVSAITGYVIGPRRGSPIGWLALGGYGLSALGSALLVPESAMASVIGVGLLGVGLGVIETLEPTVISRLAPDAAQGGALGALSAARSVGLFVADVVAGFLYASHGGVAFVYGAVLAAIAAVIIGAQAPLARRAFPAGQW